MSDVFDLSNIRKAVEDNHPVCIVVVDTNVLMNEPDFSNWKVTMGPTLFVLSDVTIQELEHIRQKRHSPDKMGPFEKATTAARNLASLFERGRITEGIPIEAGWVISVPPPDKDQLGLQLRQVEDVVQAFGLSDTKLLILTKECSQSFESTPVILLTGEVNLYNMAQMHEVPCYLSADKVFPIDDLRNLTDRMRPLDWDRVLGELQSTAREESIVVEATLTSYKAAPEWLGAESLIIAEGRGIMRDGTKNRPFLWTLPFHSRYILSGPRPQKDKGEGPDLPSLHLDFFGEDDFDQNVFDEIADRLSDCANLSAEEGKPTLQNPKSLMEMLIYFEYIQRRGVSEEALEELRREVDKSEGLTTYWADWILDSADDEAEQAACLEILLEALDRFWRIGQTYKFNLIRVE